MPRAGKLPMQQCVSPDNMRRFIRHLSRRRRKSEKNPKRNGKKNKNIKQEMSGNRNPNAI